MTTPKHAPILNSRKMRMKRNPVPWIILLVLAIALWGSMIIPQAIEWQQKRSDNKSLELLIKEIQISTDAKAQELERKEAEFELIAGPYLIREKQWFPKEIDTGRIVKILELYALQLENLDSNYRDSKFQLTKVLFGKTQRQKMKSYSSTNISLQFSSDTENFKDFVRFLQTGELSKRLLIGREKKQVAQIDYKFLENNFLPLLQIDSIQTTTNKKDGTVGVRLKANLFSQ